MSSSKNNASRYHSRRTHHREHPLAHLRHPLYHKRTYNLLKEDPTKSLEGCKELLGVPLSDSSPSKRQCLKRRMRRQIVEVSIPSIYSAPSREVYRTSAQDDPPSSAPICAGSTTMPSRTQEAQKNTTMRNRDERCVRCIQSNLAQCVVNPPRQRCEQCSKLKKGCSLVQDGSTRSMVMAKKSARNAINDRGDMAPHLDSARASRAERRNGKKVVAAMRGMRRPKRSAS